MRTFATGPSLTVGDGPGGEPVVRERGGELLGVRDEHGELGRRAAAVWGARVDEEVVTALADGRRVPVEGVRARVVAADCLVVDVQRDALNRTARRDRERQLAGDRLTGSCARDGERDRRVDA